MASEIKYQLDEEHATENVGGTLVRGIFFEPK